MINRRSVISTLTVGLVALALVLVPGQAWAPPDRDNDGFNRSQDCDDNNPAVYPGAPEICDGVIDHNCDGNVDEGCPTCTDDDGDGYYVESACGTGVDCDDSPVTGAAINPGATEACGDGVDNNCNGFTDEACSACTDGDGDGFYPSSGCGTAVDCDDDPGECGVNCFPGKDDPAEICADSYDNNCDGQVDEGCAVAGGDTDGDRIPDDKENDGFVLSSEFELWDGSVWVSPPTGGGIPIPGALDPVCSTGEKCLNLNVGDLFVIFRRLAPNSPMDPAACNFFEFASSPTSPFTVWALRELSGPSPTREITSEFPKKAAVVIEDPGMFGTTGYSEPGSIRITPEGRAWVYSLQILDNIETGCADDCVVEGSVMSNADILCRHLANTLAHEVWHVLSALLTSDGHTTLQEKIMHPATIFTKKRNKPGTYTIGDEFSAAGLSDPSF